MSLLMMMMAVMRTDIVIMMMMIFEMILNWRLEKIITMVANINDCISNKSSCWDSNSLDNYDDCNVGNDDDDDDGDDVDDDDDHLSALHSCHRKRS